MIKCRYIGKAPSYPLLGPHPVKDVLGVGLVVYMLMISLEMGRRGIFVYFVKFKSSRLESYKVLKEYINGVL